jgi:alkanesulfonate monooxygenase SsuD/methylene tetrahydromethanopterin reductase-like flavin-dependent oxidoreductase (luciferase family)
MHRLTGGRFTLGLGRGIQPLFDAFGIPRITTAQIEDFVGPCAACGGARR